MQNVTTYTGLRGGGGNMETIKANATLYASHGCDNSCIRIRKANRTCAWAQRRGITYERKG